MLTGLLSFEMPQARPAHAGDDVAFLRLIRSRRVGPATFRRLLAEHGSADAALDALPQIAAATGLRDYSPCTVAQAEAELRAGHRAGARLIRCDHPDYPALLRDIDDAPPVIWVRGDPACLSRPQVALVGARNASSLGLRMAAGMSRALAEAGRTVTAGLARGIDTAAHEAACAGGTIAVMAGGIDVIYPAENAKLADRICEAGALVSEQPPGMEPIARHFPLRNRIISGLASAVVVVEAAHRSGSLITARQALDQGREVMAVPGHPMDARASGCNALIRDGATLVRNADDVLAALANAPERDAAAPVAATATNPAAAATNPAAATAKPARAARPIVPAAAPTSAPRALAQPAATHPAPCPGDTRDQARLRQAALDRARTRRPGPSADAGGPVAVERRILNLLGPSPTDENMLIRDLGLTAAVVSAAILNLELAGRIVRVPGGRVALT